MPGQAYYTKPSIKTEKELAENIARFRHDPYGFVMFNFPWLQPGTPLEKKDGPEKWQRDLLIAVGEHSRDNYFRQQMELDLKCWRSAIASGHGVGKSALVAWIVYWLMSTRPDCRGVVTANTGDQLEQKTWPELGKWHRMALNKHWFTLTATSFYFAQYPEDQRKNYMVSAQTVGKERTEAFAGLHNETSCVFIIKDEASAIDPGVWEVAEGAFTDGEPFDFNFGNPTRPDGAFFDCFTKHAHMYYTQHVDSREVRHTNKMVINQILTKYGEDSDEAKIRVKGLFPSIAFDGFFAPQQVHDATQRENYPDNGAALVLGVDVARYGDDTTVFCPRRGRDARSMPWEKFKGLSSVEVAEKVVLFIHRYKPDFIVIESVGPGVGTIDSLRSWGYKVLEVHPGQKASRKEFMNARAEWWSNGRDWIINGGCIPDDPALFEQLTKIRYKLMGQAEQVMQMEAKHDMKTRGLSSPDEADALMLTMAVNVARRSSREDASSNRMRTKTEYDEFAMGDAT